VQFFHRRHLSGLLGDLDAVTDDDEVVAYGDQGKLLLHDERPAALEIRQRPGRGPLKSSGLDFLQGHLSDSLLVIKETIEVVHGAPPLF